jgi:hypothetical protein
LFLLHPKLLLPLAKPVALRNVHPGVLGRL